MGSPDCREERIYLTDLRRGEPAAFEKAVRENAGGMLAAARRVTGNEEDAADCVQEAFSAAFLKISEFEGRSSLRTWLHRVVINQALMKLRKRRRRPEESIDSMMPKFDEYGFLIGPVRITDETAEEMLSKKETAEAVRRAIAELPETYRVILVLRDIEELSTAEAAELLEIDEGAVRTRLHRARTVLKKMLEPIFAVKRSNNVL